MDKIGIIVKARRKELRMTQIEVSELAKVAKNSCRRIETSAGYNIRTALKIFSVLGLTFKVG